MHCADSFLPAACLPLRLPRNSISDINTSLQQLYQNCYTVDCQSVHLLDHLLIWPQKDSPTNFNFLFQSLAKSVSVNFVLCKHHIQSHRVVNYMIVSCLTRKCKWQTANPWCASTAKMTEDNEAVFYSCEAHLNRYFHLEDYDISPLQMIRSYLYYCFVLAQTVVLEKLFLNMTNVFPLEGRERYHR